MSSLNAITLQGFKSIRDLKDFNLTNLNILIGSNGAGKSNLIEFFRMLRAMSDGGLQAFLNRRGGSDGFFYDSPQVTKQIKAELLFGQNGFRFSLEPTVASEAIVTNQATYYTSGSNPNWKELGGGRVESDLPTWKGDESGRWPDVLSVRGHIHKAISNWTIYHFHDTSSTAPMRRDQSVHDFHELRPDASNIAPFLSDMRSFRHERYQRIRETIQLIAPFFDDFLLEPETKGDNKVLRLQWRQKGSTFPYQPWQLSDGTIRFICLVTALLQPTLPSTIVIDEPELGLHPFALETLAALMHETSQKTQLIVSTQSSPLLDNFSPEDVIVVERCEGASAFRRLERKDLEQWIEDYTLGSLVRKNIVETGPLYG